MLNLVVKMLLESGAFSNDIRKAKGEIQNFRKGAKDAGNVIQSFTASLGLNISSLTRLGTAAGAAAAAGKIFKDAFAANTDMMDDFKRSVEVAKSTYQSFTTQMFKSGTINIDFKGIKEQAEEYYNALDNSGVAAAAITTELRIQEAEYGRLYATAMNVSLSEVDRLEALNAASESLKRQITLKRQMAKMDQTNARQALESGLVSRGINKQWLESGEGQKMLRELLQYTEDENGYAMRMYDKYFSSIDTGKAKTGTVTGHNSAYDRAVTQLQTPAGTKALEKEAKDKGYANLNEYLKALKSESEQATETMNSVKYQLAQALHNLRGSDAGMKTIEDFVALVLENLGLDEIDAQEASMKATIERLRKRITGRDGSTVVYQEGSIGKLEEEISGLNAELKKAVTDETRDTLRDQIKAKQALLDVMKNGVVKAADLTAGSVSWLEAELDKKNKELEALNGENIGLPESAGIIDKLNEWEGTWEDFISILTDDEKDIFTKIQESLKKRFGLQTDILGLQTVLDIANAGKSTAPKKETTSNEVVYQAGSYGFQKQELQNKIASVTAELEQGTGLSADDIKKKIAELKSYKKQLENLDIAYGFQEMEEGMSRLDKFSTFTSAISSSASAVNSFASSLERMRKAQEEGASGWEIFTDAVSIGISAMNMAVSVMETINTLTELFGATSEVAAAQKVAADTAMAASTASTAGVQVAANTAVAGSGAAAAMASIPWVGPALAAAAVAGIIALLASTLPKFATGGIVGGDSFTGDRIMVRANAGEMILNRTQQAKLWKQINNGGATGGNVEFHISGTELVGVLNNNNRKARVTR